jgi:outer membrane protein, heavy metal efflux system
MSSSKFPLFVLCCGLSAALPPNLLGGESLTLSQALATALEKNPSLKVHAHGPRIAEAQALQAAIKPNPEVSLTAENFLGTGALYGVKGLETTLQLSQVVDLSGSLARRVETASAGRDASVAEYETKRIDVFAEVARRFTATAAESRRLESAREARALAEQTLAAVQARVDAAKSSSLELNKAKAALALLRIDEEHAEHELATCYASLAAALGETTPGFDAVTADLFTLPDVPEFSELAARLESSPVLARFQAEARWHEAQARLAQSLRRGSPVVSAGLRRVENTDDFGFVAGVSLPLPVRDQTGGILREARERRALSEAEGEAARLELRATLFAVYQEMLHARTALGLLRETLLPDAEASLALARQGYATGRYSLLDLLDAQKSLVELRESVVVNAAAFHLHVIELERLLGAPLKPARSGASE